jgi:hypothetical protein
MKSFKTPLFRCLIAAFDLDQSQHGSEWALSIPTQNKRCCPMSLVGPSIEVPSPRNRPRRAPGFAFRGLIFYPVIGEDRNIGAGSTMGKRARASCRPIGQKTESRLEREGVTRTRASIWCRNRTKISNALVRQPLEHPEWGCSPKRAQA